MEPSVTLKIEWVPGIMESKHEDQGHYKGADVVCSCSTQSDCRLG